MHCNLKNIFEEGELESDSVVKKFFTTAVYGKRYNTSFYNLDAIAKNYLNETEIDELNRIVFMWLDFTEDQAKQRKQVFMKDWEQKLDEFLRFNDRNVLTNAGKVSKKAADIYAKDEYNQFAQRRREYKEIVGQKESIKQLEEAAKLLPQNKLKGNKRQ